VSILETTSVEIDDLDAGMAALDPPEEMESQGGSLRHTLQSEP